jgi:hypothetical protein
MTRARFLPLGVRVDEAGPRREDENVTAKTPGDEAFVAALCEALAPYPWRRFTPELLARFALAAHDRQALTVALSSMRGAAVGGWERLEPVDRSDGRAAPLVEFLTDRRWPSLRLPALCRDLAVLVAGAGPRTSRY